MEIKQFYVRYCPEAESRSALVVVIDGHAVEHPLSASQARTWVLELVTNQPIAATPMQMREAA